MESERPPLRILFITQDDPLYVIEFFETFLREYSAAVIQPIGITVARAFGEALGKTALRSMRFYGPIDFARLAVRFARAKITGRSIRHAAIRARIPLVPARSVNAPAYVAAVMHLRPDVIVSVAAPEIFRADLLAAAPRGCINIHSGRLPRYRGMMPVFWQMAEGEECVTVTVHKMVAKVDAGSILGTVAFRIGHPDSLDRVIRGTKQAGARLMIDILAQIQSGTASPAPLDMGNASYFRFPAPENVREFRRRGHKMF